MIAIGRYIEGISLNGLEYVLDDDGAIELFDSEDEAISFLHDNNFTDKDIEFLVLEEVDA